MKWFKDNKLLLKNYLIIGLLNIIFYILTSFYLNTNETQSIILLFIVLVSDFIIYYINGQVKFKIYLDIIFNIILGIILMFIIENEYIYSITLFSILIPNNIIYVRSRLNEKFIIRTLQYIETFIIIILCMFINLAINSFI